MKNLEIRAGLIRELMPEMYRKVKPKNVTESAVKREIIIELPGGLEIVSVITKTSAYGWLTITKTKVIRESIFFPSLAESPC